MKRIQLLPLLLCLCLALAACGGLSSEPVPPEVQTAATGRFVEQPINFPGLYSITTFDRVAPDTYYIMGLSTRDSDQQVWYSEGGEDWEPLNCPALAGLEVAGAAFQPDGSFYISYLSEQVDEQTYLSKTAYVEGDTRTDIDGIPELDNFCYSLLTTDSGDLVVNRGFSFQQVDLDTGIVADYDMEDGQVWTGNYLVYGDTLAFCTGPNILLFDLLSGDESGRLSTVSGGSSTCIAVADDRSGFFYCNSDGLYKVTMDGGITEQLIDGSLASFGMPSSYLNRFYPCTDGSFLLMAKQGDSYRLSRYVYDPDMSREPSQELTLYSLWDDDFVRHAIGMYQRDNPDVMIRHTVGTEGGAVTAADAMRTLSTELLAGGGPDILVLDGLPIDSYIRHGVLLDLDGPLSGTLSELLPRVADAFRGDGSLPAVPGRVSVPVIGGIGVEDITGLDSLADYMEASAQPRMGVTADSIMDLFYPMFSPSWLGSGGSLDTRALTADLAAMKRILDVGESHPYNRDNTGVLHQAVWWSGDGMALICAPLSRLEDMAHAYTAFGIKGGGSVKAFPGESGVLIPSSILAVNAAGEQQDAALDFVDAALSPEVQHISFLSGMPVRPDILAAVADGNQPGESMGAIGQGYNDDSGDVFNMETFWPDPEQMEEAIRIVRSATTVSYSDETVRQIFFDETVALWLGGRSVEDTVQALSSKVERYLQEQS